MTTESDKSIEELASAYCTKQVEYLFVDSQSEIQMIVFAAIRIKSSSTFWAIII